MFRIFITSGIYYAASANILKAVQYVVIYGMSEMRCNNPEYWVSLVNLVSMPNTYLSSVLSNLDIPASSIFDSIEQV